MVRRFRFSIADHALRITLRRIPTTEQRDAQPSNVLRWFGITSGLIAVIAFFVASVWLTTNEQDSQAARQKAPRQQDALEAGPTEARDDTPQQQPRPDQQSHHLVDRVWNWLASSGPADYTLVLIGGLAAVAAILTLRALNEQIRLMRKQSAAGLKAANATRDAVLLSHPAQLVVRAVVVHGFGAEGVALNIGKAYVRIVNVGHGTATILFRKAEWYFFRHLPMENPIEHQLDRSGIAVSLPPGAFWTFDLPSRSLSPQEHKDIVDSDTFGSTGTSLYLIGYVKFSDAKRPLRRVFFCRRFDTELGRFVSVDNPDYEYED